MRRLFLAVFLAFALAASLGACGGGNDSSTGGAGSSTVASESSTTPPAFLAHTEAAAKTAAERRQAGAAAAFVKPKADNSVPTFGSEAGASERDQAEAALKAYLTARAKADWSSACRELAASTRQGYEKLAKSSSKAKALGCAQVLGALSKGADLSDPLTGHLVSLRVKGPSAFALFYGPAHQQYIVPMNREADQWRPTQAAPIAYPPAAPAPTSP